MISNRTTFSLLSIHTEYDGKVDGAWINDHIGTVESAREAADRLEDRNSNKIKIAVVSEVPFCMPCEPFVGKKRVA